MPKRNYFEEFCYSTNKKYSTLSHCQVYNGLSLSRAVSEIMI